jgi:hypothetical protein
MDATRSPRPAPTKPQWPSKNAAELGHQLVQDIGRPAGALRVPAIQPLGMARLGAAVLPRTGQPDLVELRLMRCALDP